MRSELEAYFGIPFPLFDVTIYCSVVFVRTREVNKVFVSSLGYHLKCVRILRRYQYSMFTLCIDILFGHLLNARLIQQWLLLQIWRILKIKNDNRSETRGWSSAYNRSCIPTKNILTIVDLLLVTSSDGHHNFTSISTSASWAVHSPKEHGSAA